MMVFTTGARPSPLTQERITTLLTRHRQAATGIRLIRRLALARLQRRHIPPDDASIVRWLDDVGCRSHAATERDWIAYQQQDPDLDSKGCTPRSLAGTLTRRLQGHRFVKRDTLL